MFYQLCDSVSFLSLAAIDKVRKISLICFFLFESNQAHNELYEYKLPKAIHQTVEQEMLLYHITTRSPVRGYSDMYSCDQGYDKEVITPFYTLLIFLHLQTAGSS